jgi:hypothetical protein
MKWLESFFDLIWPHPDKVTDAQRVQYEQEDKEDFERIKDWQGNSDPEISLYLDAARRVLEEEAQRKSSADTRATAFIAAIATLIPLMTWALGSSSPACERGVPCIVWASVFTIAVVYLARAALWSLRTLAVANYHVIGVEDLVCMNKENKKQTTKELIKKTLLVARKNRDTINGKLTDIKIAQRCLVNGIIVLACLLAADPWLRFSLSPAKAASSTTSLASCPLSSITPATSEPASKPSEPQTKPALAAPPASVSSQAASTATSAAIHNSRPPKKRIAKGHACPSPAP